MKFDFYFKYFLVWFLIVIIPNYSMFVSLFTSQKQDISTTPTTVTASLWDIQNTIEVVWSSELVDEQSLSFNQAWTITAVYVKSWDTVKKWDIIAEIDNTDALDSIEEAKISLENANISLQQLYEPTDESKIIQAKNSIVTAENNLTNSKKEFENLKTTQENSIEKLKESIDTSKKELETLIKEKENSISNTTTNKSATVVNIEDDFKTYLIDIDSIIQDCDTIMWVTQENKEKNDAFEYYLWAKDAIIKSKAKTALLESISIYKTLVSTVNGYDYSWDKDTIKGILNEISSMYDNLYSTTDYIYKTVDTSVTSLWSLTDSEIDSMMNSMSWDRSTTLNKISSIKSQINTLDTLTDVNLISQSNQLEIEKQEISIKNAEKSYQETVAEYALNIESRQQDIDSKQVTLEIAKLSLEELLEWPTDENIKKANNTIKQAELKLESSYENLDDYQLIAPFDWVIRKIDYMVWDNLTNDTDKYVYIENPNLVEITVMLDQIDIVTVKNWQEATVTFDSFSNNPLPATISSIDTAPTQSSWVISYEVKLVLDDQEFNTNILSWMTANVEIITESRKNVVLLKTTAIKEKDWKNYVLLDENGVQVETNIEIWISSDWMTEIVSWLNEWDVVYVEQFVSTSTDAQETSTSLFWTPWGWWNKSWNMQGPPWWF